MSSTKYVNESTAITTEKQQNKTKENLTKQSVQQQSGRAVILDDCGGLGGATISQKLLSSKNKHETIFDTDDEEKDTGGLISSVAVTGNDEDPDENERDLSATTKEIAPQQQPEINTLVRRKSDYRKFYKFSLNMVINYGKEILCILALILTTCATFQNG